MKFNYQVFQFRRKFNLTDGTDVCNKNHWISGLFWTIGLTLRNFVTRTRCQVSLQVWYFDYIAGTFCYLSFLSGNFSVTGFELTLRRKMSHYIITYYFPAGMFVIVSWISFLVPPESVPGRMTILVTVFLVLVNIFNSITSNIPKADGLTAIESFIIVCIIFVFGALIGNKKVNLISNKR